MPPKILLLNSDGRKHGCFLYGRKRLHCYSMNTKFDDFKSMDFTQADSFRCILATNFPEVLHMLNINLKHYIFLFPVNPTDAHHTLLYIHTQLAPKVDVFICLIFYLYIRKLCIIKYAASKLY